MNSNASFEFTDCRHMDELYGHGIQKWHLSFNTNHSIHISSVPRHYDECASTVFFVLFSLREELHLEKM